MYAIVETGGKQYSATPGKIIEVDKLPVEPGQQVAFTRVLLIADGAQVTVGTPVVAGATVTATVLRQARRRKVTWFKYTPKKRIRKKGGQRQHYTALRVDGVQTEAAAAETAAEQPAAEQSAAVEA